MGHRGRTITAAGLLVLLAAAALVALARYPGGPVSVVAPYGQSMQPTLSADDLVVMRHTTDYATGDVAAYHSTELDTVVLHRIVEIDSDRYIFQGDNNTWIDPDQPTADDLIGVTWFVVPLAGALTRIPTSIWIALALGAGALAALVRPRPTPHTPTPPTNDSSRSVAPELLSRSRRAALPAAVVLAAALALGVVAFTTPATTDGPVTYTHRATFGYHADASAGEVYPDGQVTSGDTVFLSLVDEIELTFDYDLTTGADHDVTASAWLEATVADGSGWEQTIPLGDPVGADAGEVELSAHLDLAEIHALVDDVQEQTGVGGASRTLTVSAQVETAGELAGQQLDDHFTPGISFALDEHRLHLTRGADDDADEPFTATETGSVTAADIEPNQLEVLGLNVAVDHARLAALAAGIAAVLVLAAAGAAIARTRHADEVTRIRARYAHTIVTAADVRPPDGRTIVESTTIGDLARISDALATPIIHRRWAGTDTFLVDTGTTVYWYEADPHHPDNEPTQPRPDHSETSRLDEDHEALRVQDAR